MATPALWAHKFLLVQAHYELAAKLLRAPGSPAPAQLEPAEQCVLPSFDGTVVAVAGDSSHVTGTGPHAGVTPDVVLSSNSMLRKDGVTPFQVRSGA